MKKLLLIFVLLSLLINQTTLAYTLTKVDTKIANNKIKILSERIKKGSSYQIIYKQQLSLQNNIKKNRDKKNIKSAAYKNLDKSYTISQYILENLINYGTVKQNIVSNLPIKIQDTIIQEQTIIKKQSCDNGWYYNEGKMSCQPNYPIRSCNIVNGIGEQIWNGNNWENCIIASCNSGYSVSNGSCLVNQSTQQTDPISNQPTCSSDQHIENNACISNIKSCTFSNGFGQQSWSSNAWGSCIVSSCNAGYSTSGNSCTQNQPTCSSDQHKEVDSCIPNTKSCTISNGTGQKFWNGNSWGTCKVSSCIIGFSESNDACIKEIKINDNLGCDTADIALPNGQVWAACNVGATKASEYAFCTDISSCTKERIGDHYQWGRNDTGFSDEKYIPQDNWESTKQGPCAAGYHIPTQSEWKTACDTISGSDCTNSPITVTAMHETLKLPFADRYGYTAPSLMGNNGYYWSSTSGISGQAFILNFRSNFISTSPSLYTPKSSAFSVRCIKN